VRQQSPESADTQQAGADQRLMTQNSRWKVVVSALIVACPWSRGAWKTHGLLYDSACQYRILGTPRWFWPEKYGWML